MKLLIAQSKNCSSCWATLSNSCLLSGESPAFSCSLSLLQQNVDVVVQGLWHSPFNQDFCNSPKDGAGARHQLLLSKLLIFLLSKLLSQLICFCIPHLGQSKVALEPKTFTERALKINPPLPHAESLNCSNPGDSSQATPERRILHFYCLLH